MLAEREESDFGLLAERDRDLLLAERDFALPAERDLDFCLFVEAALGFDFFDASLEGVSVAIFSLSSAGMEFGTARGTLAQDLSPSSSSRLLALSSSSSASTLACFARSSAIAASVRLSSARSRWWRTSSC
ncbi:MAG TPA: hypothetical protein VGC49_10295 [Solirubrobacterales bacterium]